MVKSTPRATSVKRYLKFLSICKDPITRRQVIKNSPDNVIKGIANAALNAQKGQVKLTKGQALQLGKYRKEIYSLTDKAKSIKAKRGILVQHGGLAILPLLLSTVLATLGSAVVDRVLKP